MKQALIFIAVTLLITQNTWAQAYNHNIDLTSAFGIKDVSLSFSYEYNFEIGKAKRLELGIGGRITYYNGQDKEYITAPANLTKGKTGPLVLFTSKQEKYLDTILIGKPGLTAINLLVNAGYKISPKVIAGFNLDIIGFSVGKKQTAEYLHNGEKAIVSAKPASFNFLKIDDNALGSLNSELYLVYKWNNRWSIKAFAEYLYLEYKTSTKIQLDGGEMNDRFRDKPISFGAGVSYFLK